MSLNYYYRSRGLLTEERLGYFLEECAAFWPDRQLICHDGQRFTYREIHRWSLAIAQQLYGSGVRPGDIVMIQGANSIPLLVAQFAVWRIGAICAPVLSIYRHHEVRSIASDIKPRAIIADPSYGSRDLHAEIDEIVAEIGLQVVLKLAIKPGTSQSGWEPLATAPPTAAERLAERLPEPAPSDECSVILFTSGTSSRPKGAVLAGGGILSQARALGKSFGLSATHDAVLVGSPLSHTAALSYGVLMPMTLGLRVVVLTKWDATEAVKLIDSERLTIMSAPVLFLYDLVERYESVPNDLHRLRIFSSGGGVNPPSLIRRADALGIKATRNYGMTEVCGGVTFISPGEDLERRATCDGRALPGAELEIVDDRRNILPAGEEGEVRLRSPQLMLRYTEPEQTSLAVDADRWFYSGDLGVLSPEGWLTITGRLKDIINRGGEKFSASDIEATLTTHPAIAEAAVVGAPDERFGEVVAAGLKLRPGAVWNGPEDILRHLEVQKIAKQKFPTYWKIMDELPRTATGKIHKETLRKLFADELS